MKNTHIGTHKRVPRQPYIGALMYGPSSDVWTIPPLYGHSDVWMNRCTEVVHTSELPCSNMHSDICAKFIRSHYVVHLLNVKVWWFIWFFHHYIYNFIEWTSNGLEKYYTIGKIMMNWDSWLIFDNRSSSLFS